MNGKQIAVLLTFLAAATLLFTQTEQPERVDEYVAWKSDFGMQFTQAEDDFRRQVFLANLRRIEAHNSNPARTYDMGVNQFTHLTQEEFQDQYLSGLLLPVASLSVEDSLAWDDNLAVGDVDWTTKDAVTPVKNQGNCGSCWAFSTTGSLEALSKLGYGTLQSFSEQQLVDCSSSYGNQGCNGGLMDNAFKFVKAHGIVHEDEYPYKAVQAACKTPSGPFKISGFTDIKNCNDLATGLASRPISVAVDATNWSTYKSGVFNNCKTSLNHGVLLVGLTDQFWKVKNSWGTSWGESGFIRLARGNTCGICNVASFPNK